MGENMTVESATTNTKDTSVKQNESGPEEPASVNVNDLGAWLPKVASKHLNVNGMPNVAATVEEKNGITTVHFDSKFDNGVDITTTTSRVGEGHQTKVMYTAQGYGTGTFVINHKEAPFVHTNFGFGGTNIDVVFGEKPLINHIFFHADENRIDNPGLWAALLANMRP